MPCTSLAYLQYFLLPLYLSTGRSQVADGGGRDGSADEMVEGVPLCCLLSELAMVVQGSNRIHVGGSLMAVYWNNWWLSPCGGLLKYMAVVTKVYVVVVAVWGSTQMDGGGGNMGVY